MTVPNKRPLTLSYINVRRIIGILGMALPIVTASGARVFFDIRMQESISAYYYTPMVFFFVFTLIFTGIFLFFYRGFTRQEMLRARFSGFSAIMVAVFPTPPVGNTGFNGAALVGIIHMLFALAFLWNMSWFCLSAFHKTADFGIPTKNKLRRNKVYRWCGIIIRASLLLLPVLAFLAPQLKPVFWVELIGLFAFGLAWAVKGEVLFSDVATERDRADFNKLQRAQYDNYRSGLVYIVLMIAVWFTVILFSANVDPFNVFSKAATSADSSTPSVVELTVSPPNAGGDSKSVSIVQITGADSFSNLTFETEPQKSWTTNLIAELDGLAHQLENQWGLESEESASEDEKEKLQGRLTISNLSPQPIIFDLDFQVGNTCQDEKGEARACQIAISHAETGVELSQSQLEVPGNKSEEYELTFEEFAQEGAVFLTGGGTLSRLPFEISSLPDLNLSTDGKARLLGFTQDEARAALLSLLFIVSSIVIFMVLDTQLLNRFWPLVRRDFKVDLGKEEKDKEGENTQIWNVFLNTVNKLGVNPAYSISPVQDIELPSSFTPEGSYLKTLFDAISWIIPKTGFSIKVRKNFSPSRGAGLSLAITDLGQRDTVANRVVWEDEFLIKPDPDPAKKLDEVDLDRFARLSVPAFFWFTQQVDYLDGFDVPSLQWQARALYKLGFAQVYANGMPKLSKSIELDPSYLPAYAALGRFWQQKSQAKGLSKALALQYLEHSREYLEYVTENSSGDSGDPELNLLARRNMLVADYFVINLSRPNRAGKHKQYKDIEQRARSLILEGREHLDQLDYSAHDIDDLTRLATARIKEIVDLDREVSSHALDLLDTATKLEPAFFRSAKSRIAAIKRAVKARSKEVVRELSLSLKTYASFLSSRKRSLKDRQVVEASLNQLGKQLAAQGAKGAQAATSVANLEALFDPSAQQKPKLLLRFVRLLENQTEALQLRLAALKSLNDFMETEAKMRGRRASSREDFTDTLLEVLMNQALPSQYRQLGLHRLKDAAKARRSAHAAAKQEIQDTVDLLLDHVEVLVYWELNFLSDFSGLLRTSSTKKINDLGIYTKSYEQQSRQAWMQNLLLSSEMLRYRAKILTDFNQGKQPPSPAKRDKIIQDCVAEFWEKLDKKPILDDTLLDLNYQVHYSLACFYAIMSAEFRSGSLRQNYQDSALDYLELATNGKPFLIQYAGEDSDLQALHGSKRFKRLIGSALPSAFKADRLVKRISKGNWLNSHPNTSHLDTVHTNAENALKRAREMLAAEGGGTLVMVNSSDEVVLRQEIASAGKK